MRKIWNRIVGILWFLNIILYTNGLAQSFLPVYQKGSCKIEIDLVIGGDTENEDYLLNNPREICVDSQGNIFVLDFGENNIKKFDTNGDYLKTIGRNGSGPGELIYPLNMDLDKNEQIIILEFGNRRFSFFNNDGVFLHTIPTTNIGIYPKSLKYFKISPDGKIYVEIHENDFSGKKGGTLIEIWQFTPDFAEQKLVDSTRIKLNDYIYKGNSMSNIPVPFHHYLFWDISSSGNIVLGLSENYTIKIISPNLKLLKQITHSGKKLKVTSEDKELFFSQMRGGSAIGTVQIGAPPEIRRLTRFPKEKPYFKDLKVDSEGYILIQTYEKAGNNCSYDVFSPEGQFLNRVILPQMSEDSILANGYVYDIRRPEDGFPSVVRYRVK